VCGNVGRRRADDQLHGEETANGHAVFWCGADTKADVDAVLYSVANAVIQFYVGLDLGMAAAKLVDQGPEQWQERILRGDDVQRPCDLVLCRANAVDGALQGRQRGLGGFEELLSFGGEGHALCRAMQQAYAQPLFESRERLARSLRTDALGCRSTPNAAELDGLCENLDRAKFADGHVMLLEMVSRQYQPVLAIRSRTGPPVAREHTAYSQALLHPKESLMSDKIKGKVIVITGASSGLGEAAARLLSAQVAHIVLGARRIERLQQLADELNLPEQRTLTVATDVTVLDEVKHLVDTAVQSFGRIDVMVNNAGLMPLSALERLKVDDWDRMIDVNVKGVLYGIAAALPHMQRQMSGHIVNVSSVAGHKVMFNGAVYSATKHAVRALSEGLRQEIKPWNIRTTIVSPGAVDSELPGSITEPDVARGMQDFYQANAIPADSFGRAQAFAIDQPDDMDVNEILFRPTRQVA
jgi:NADP-dependent 3-hydroxy acid dehydrogenase YdfG